MKTLIVCASRYGSSNVIGEWIAERLAFQCEVCSFTDAPPPGGFDLVILGGGIYEDGFLPGFVEYIKQHIQILNQKKTAVFAVCMDATGVYVGGRVTGGWNYIMPVIALFDNPPLHAGILHGEINPTKLTPEDTQKILHFYNVMLKRNYQTVPFKTMMNKEEAWVFAERLLHKL